MSDADAGPVQSRPQLERLVASGRLSGRTCAGFAAPRANLREADMDGVQWARVDLQDADCTLARLERGEVTMVDGRRSVWDGALWHRVVVRDADFTEANFTGAHWLRCQLTNARMGRLRLAGARVADSIFTTTELYGAQCQGAVFVRTRFVGYQNVTVSLTRADFRGATLIECDLADANLYGADLSDAKLIRCNVRGASLAHCNLAMSSWVACQTDGVDLDGART